MQDNPRGIAYTELMKVCEHYFGKPRSTGGSHAVFKTPWPGDPRVNIQNDHGRAKPYQVRQVLAAIEKKGGDGKMSTAIDTARYSFRVTWSAEDDEFVATCVEFPSLSWLAGTPELALSGLRNLVSDVVADLLASGEAVPEPLSTRHYSGKFQLRLGEDLHRRLAMEAAEQSTSLNQYVVQKLAAVS